MIKTSFAFVAACTLLTVPVLAADSIDAIVANPAAFDGKRVSVHGTVADVKQKTSHRGNDYTLFDVCEAKCVHVYAHGHPGLANGAVVTVTGTFAASKSLGSFTVTNQIDADDGSGTPAPAVSAAPSSPPVR